MGGLRETEAGVRRAEDRRADRAAGGGDGGAAAAGDSRGTCRSRRGVDKAAGGTSQGEGGRSLEEEALRLGGTVEETGCGCARPLCGLVRDLYRDLARGPYRDGGESRDGLSLGLSLGLDRRAGFDYGFDCGSGCDWGFDSGSSSGPGLAQGGSRTGLRGAGHGGALPLLPWLVHRCQFHRRRAWFPIPSLRLCRCQDPRTT